MNAEYRHTTYKELVSFLKKIEIKNFRQLNGGFTTDFDKPFSKDRYFAEKIRSTEISAKVNSTMLFDLLNKY